MGSGSSKKAGEDQKKTPKKTAGGRKKSNVGNGEVQTDVHRQPPKGARRRSHSDKPSTRPSSPLPVDFIPYEPENLDLTGNWELEKGTDTETPLTEMMYPAPRPGKVITDRSHFSAVDFDIFQKNDMKLASGTFEEVAGTLANGRESDILKVRAFTTWMSCQKIRTRQYGKDIKKDSVLAYMKQINDEKGTFAGLLALLCRSMEIPCVIIRGMYKSMQHHVGEDDVRDSHCTWNAVHVDGHWQLVHPYLICTPLCNSSPTENWKLFETSKEEPPPRNAAVLNSFFFAPNPAEFVKLCLPLPMHTPWQLIHESIKYPEFIQFPFLRPAFHEAGMQLVSCDKGVVLSEAGACSIRIKCQPATVNDITFMYELSCFDPDFQVDPEWGNLVLCGRCENTWNVQMKFPVNGTYKIALFANLFDWFFWIGDFKIVCDIPFHNFVPQPVVPKEVGYGPGSLSEGAGLLCPSHLGGIIFYKPNETHVIKFSFTERIFLKHGIENAERDTEELHQYCRMCVHRNEVDFVVCLPFRGEFALRIYKLNDNMEPANVCNYLLTDADDGKGRENLFQRRARNTIREATAGHDISVLENALAKFEASKLEKDDDYHRAERRLYHLKLRRGLRDGRLRRHELTLRKAISDAENSPFSVALSKSIEQAKLMLTMLESLEMNCHPVQEMSHQTIAEIANFNNPPRDVHNIMIATYLLLGEDKSYLQKWGNIQGLLRRPGKENVKVRIKEFHNSPVPDRSTIQAVQRLHDSVPKPYIMAASLSAAAFYDWVDGALAYLHNTSQNAMDAECSFDTEENSFVNDRTNNNSTGYHSHKGAPDDLSQDEGFQDTNDSEIANSGQ